jgi:serine/threonine protein phosphatase PrpC/CRP-like cAMP-binding protein
MLSFSHLTDTGKKRDHNEDFYDYDEALGLFVVCDGMGGHAAGEVASELACKTVFDFLRKKEKVFSSLIDSHDQAKKKRISALIEQAIVAANQAVYDLSMKDESKRGMGTTIVLCLVTKAGIFVGHVGDSRAYLIRKQKLIQMTEDHSLVNELIKSGAITKEKAKNHPQGNVITQAVGIQEVVRPDVLFHEVMDSDTIFICSDGLHDYLDDEIALKIREKSGIKLLSHEYIRFANAKGGKDNITCISLQWGDQLGPPAHPSDVTVAKKIETLKKINLFAGLNYKELSQLLEIIQVRTVESHTTMVKEGEVGEDMFIILKGRVDILYGRDKIAELGPGKFFGEMSLIDKTPRSATIITSSTCKFMRILRSDLFPLLKKEPRIGLKVFWAFLQNMNVRLRENDKKLFEMNQGFLSAADISPKRSEGEKEEGTDTWNLSSLD